MPSYDTQVFLPAKLLVDLGEHTGHFWSDPLLEAVIHDAVRAWMKPVPPVQQQPAAPSEAGYQWKQVFLPEGTRLRASFGRQPYFAVVEGAQIKREGQSISPSSFANLRGSGNRNAWKAIWLRLPGSDEWLLADVCRSARKSAIARMFGGDPPAPKARSRAMPRVRQNKKQQPAARHSAPLQTDAQPPNAEAAHDHGNGKQRKNGSGRTARRKRRAAKHVPNNP